MCGGSAPDQKPSAHDIALAQKAAGDDRRFEDFYVPLEVFEIEQLRDPAVQKINRDIISGRINADVAKAEHEGLRSAVSAAQASGASLGSASNQAAVDAIEAETGRGLSMAKTEADREARNIHDAEALSVTRTGQGVNRGNTEGLADAANRENYLASNRLRNQVQVNNSRAKALGDVASAAVIGGTDAYKRATNSAIANEQLSTGARGLRSLMGADPWTVGERNANSTLQRVGLRG